MDLSLIGNVCGYVALALFGYVAGCLATLWRSRRAKHNATPPHPRNSGDHHYTGRY